MTYQKPKAKQPKTRKRAPACGRDLGPNMPCPVKGRLEPDTSSGLLGLCGPSELQNLPRTRLRLVAAQHVQRLPDTPAGSSAELALRRKLTCLDKTQGLALLQPHIGRRDVVQHILSFVEAERPLKDTEVGGKMFADSGSANVDLFFQAVPQSKPQENQHLKALLENAWAESPEVCLKQIFLLGSREGKQDRYSFYDAMLWLWQRDPATVLANLHLVPECNYWKGLLELLARVCEGPRRSLERDVALFGHYMRSSKRAQPKYLAQDAEMKKRDGKGKRGADHGGTFQPGSRLEMAEEALKRYDADPLYRAFFQRVGQLFARQLQADHAQMKRGERVSLCAKWCPLLYHSFDRRTLICEAIARWLYPADAKEFDGCTEREYAYRARDKLRRSLSELKEYMKSPERLMCQKRWTEIRYKRVPAQCLSNNARSFQQNDPDRFGRFLALVEAGKVKVNTGALQPHQLLKKAACIRNNPLEKVLAQGQWRGLVQRAKTGGLQDCVAVCDVSGSMASDAAPKVSCMDVSVAMSLLLAEAASGPYARHIITFHEEPRLVALPETEDLAKLGDFVRRLDWGGSTNFHKVFQLLEKYDTPPKKVVVFSDMQFADAGGDMAVLRKVQKRYQKFGLEMPELVFWNLRGGDGAPALANETGVVLMSGFSSRMLKTIMEPTEASDGKKEKQKLDPISALSRALEKPLFAKVRVVYDPRDARELFVAPLPLSRSFAPESKATSPMAVERPTSKRARLPLALRSTTLGEFPNDEAVAAFIGRCGHGVSTLRALLHKQLATVLGVHQQRLLFWLDVKEPSSGDEGGRVEATVEAHLPSFDLQKALHKLHTHAAGFLDLARQRAKVKLLSHAARLEIPRSRRRKVRQ